MSLPAAYAMVGFEQVSLSDSSAHGPASVPANAAMAIIIPEGGDLRLRADGTDPTASVGIPVLQGAEWDHPCDPSKLRFIRQTAVTVTVNIAYFQ
jgi:hypothetical protein